LTEAHVIAEMLQPMSGVVMFVCLDVCRQILGLYSGCGPSVTTQQPQNPSGKASVVAKQQLQSSPRKAGLMAKQESPHKASVVAKQQSESPARKATVFQSVRRRSSPSTSSVSALCCF